MKLLKYRLLFAFTSWIIALLAGLLIIFGQLFPIYSEGNQETVWFMLTLFFSAAVLLSWVFFHRLIEVYTQPIENAAHTALELAKGNYQARAAEYETGRVLPLSTSINVLARNLQEITAFREMEQERLKTLIENMGSALMMIDRQGRVTLMNKTFIDEFSTDPDEALNELFDDINLPKPLADFIEMVFVMENPARTQLELSHGVTVRHMDVYGAPIIGSHERWLGIVIVLHDITELKRLEQVRKDFVANVSHELRTPVTSIKGFSETLLDGAYKDTPVLLSFLEIIQKESNRLEMLIKDLLELSKYEQHGFQLSLTETSLEEIVKTAQEMVNPRMEEKQISMELSVTGNVVIEADKNRIMQVVMNLLTNAVSYSSERTKVKVSIWEEKHYVFLTVADQGMGISESELPRIFERFYRVDRARSRNSGGTGLGLAIVKHLTEAHHGRISASSKVGEGTTFQLKLPKKQPL